MKMSRSNSSMVSNNINSMKAYELSSVIERITLGEKVRIQIECIDYCGTKLYVGTSDSFIIEFNLENARKTAQQTQYKYLAYKKPIIIVKAVFVLERLLCICDSNLVILNQNDLEPLSYGNKMKNVNTFCFNENPAASNPFSVEICIARKKQLVICDLTSEKMIPLKEINLSKPALSLSMDSSFICVGTDSLFYMINWSSNHVTDLCACDQEIVMPITKRITKEEFLISGPGLGLYVKSTGISERPPLQWGSQLIAIAYSHPYILCLNDTSILIFSIVDQEMKQSIPFSGGVSLENCDGNIFVASNDSIFSLSSVPWEQQVKMLLSNKKVKEALNLIQNWHQAGVSKEKYNQLIGNIRQQAGFVEFSNANFDEAKEHFIEGNLDLRELLSLYPGLLQDINSYSRTVAHDIVDVYKLTQDDEQALLKYKIFLIDYLEDCKNGNSDQYKACQYEVDTALVVLYSQIEAFSARLLELFTDPKLDCDTEWVIEKLLETHHYHALALYYSQNSFTYEDALDIWIKIESQEYHDEAYPGIKCIADFLVKIKDDNILMKYLGFILDRDQQLGVRVIIKRMRFSNTLDPDVILNFLQRYSYAQRIFLEFIVLERKLDKEKFHTHLASIYIGIVIQQLTDTKSHSSSQSLPSSSELVHSRERLQHFLHSSSLYRVQLILGKAIDAKLDRECAILYGKLGEHDKALTILVQDVQDYKLAEQYCVHVSSQQVDHKKRYEIFHTLLGIYLDLSQKNYPHLITPALQLLNSEETEFDTIKVLQLIPQNWSINIIEQFICKSLRRSLHKTRQTMIARGLSNHQTKSVKCEKLYAERKSIYLNEDRICAICKGNLIEAECVWYPYLGLVLHPYCGKGIANT